MRAVEAESARRPRPSPSPAPADQAAAATTLEDAITRAIGCDVRARPHRHGYQIILDHHGAQRLGQLLATNEGSA